MTSGDKTIERRSFLKAAGGAAAMATFAGCTTGDDTETTDGADTEGKKLLTYARGSDSTTLDTQATTTGEDAKVTNQVYDRLIHFEPGTASLVAGLAEEFTAADVVATYDRFVNEDYEHFVGKENQSIYGPYLLGKVEEVTTDGDYAVNFELSQRYAPFLGNLAVFALAILSKTEIEENGDALGEKPVGTGAFEFDNWDTGSQRIRLTANDDYWGEGPYVDEIVFNTIGQNSTRAQALDAGEADIVDGIGAQAAKQIQNSSNASLEKTAGMTVGYMAFNMAKREEFQNRKVRRAISYAINTKAIVENIYKGMAVQATHPLPPTVMGHNEDIEPYAHDPEKAKSLLEEAGYGDGFSFTLSTMTNPRPYFASPVQTAETVKSNLAEVGIDVTIDKQSWSPYLTYTSEGKHDACFLGWISDNGDPDNYYSPLLLPGVDVEDVPDGQDWVSRDMEDVNTGNRAAWANTEFMELVEEGKKNYNTDEREDIYLEASQITHDEAPWVFMTHTEVLRGVSNRVQDFTVAPVDGPFLSRVKL